MKMTWQYIAGFFDADGSVTLVRQKSTESRSVAVYFTNTDKQIPKEIESFLSKECKVKGLYFSPKKVKDHHLQGYDLRYQRGHALTVAAALLPYIMHQKKVERIRLLLNEYRPLIKANGKYSNEEKIFIEQVAKKFLEIK